ncbi:hypothetical protein B7755_043650 [Streptomyces sp. NBS 14/10]|uniref:tetratricopeptide repeat protein n=1 Tax=Streptomyces sp. NBS 14/10 TaxID=1945643 RepID=UPI00117E3E51|nr:hypothetical protein [Streptomyces sp. NBS 14/10]KAK1184395.1 hypothetical protein B7755_043650 [Streptomyces sp. NBS 14/10]
MKNRQQTSFGSASCAHQEQHIYIKSVEKWDPLSLGVHQPVGRESMTDYIEREHDESLYAALDRCHPDGAFTIMLGEGSTGKSRSAYECIRSRFPARLLVHQPSIEKLIEWLDSADVDTDVILWLGPLDEVLVSEHGKVLAKMLSHLLETSKRTTVIGEMRLTRWNSLVSTPGHKQQDIHDDVRVLLRQAEPVQVPGGLTAKELSMAQGTLPSLIWDDVDDTVGDHSRVLQLVSGAFQVIEYAERFANPGAQAIITAGVEATLLGHVNPLPLPLLERAAVGYLRSRGGTFSAHHWFGTALQQATASVKGAMSPLTLVSREEEHQSDKFIIARHLCDHARHSRVPAPVPTEMWEALLEHTASPTDLVRAGVSAEKRSLFRCAVRLYELAAEQDDTFAMCQLARRLERVHRTEEAEVALRRATALGDLYALDELVGLLERSGRHSEAETLAHLVDEGGNSCATYQLIGLLERTGQPEQALKLLQQASNAGNTDATLELARRLEHHGQTTHAQQLLHHAAEANDADAIMALATEYRRAGRIVEAEQCLSRASEAGEPAASYQLARMNPQSADIESAARAAALLGDTSARYELAKYLEHSGRRDEARLIVLFGLEPSGDTAAPW